MKALGLRESQDTGDLITMSPKQLDEHVTTAVNSVTASLRARMDILEEALEKIVDPIKFLREEAEKNGNTLDGTMTIKLTENHNYLRNIAVLALKRYHDQE
jgi:hypothetical protein